MMEDWVFYSDLRTSTPLKCLEAVLASYICCFLLAENSAEHHCVCPCSIPGPQESCIGPVAHMQNAYLEPYWYKGEWISVQEPACFDSCLCTPCPWRRHLPKVTHNCAFMLRKLMKGYSEQQSEKSLKGFVPQQVLWILHAAIGYSYVSLREL